jgi:alcohol dehydrogenase
MKAAIYHGPKDVRCGTVPDPEIRHPHEILVRVEATSICGSDLHLYRGAFDGILVRGHSRTGHELAGEVIDVGTDAGDLRRGDRVTMAYSASCGACALCRVGQTAHCEVSHKAVYGFGPHFGDLNGTHAEALVLPYAAGHVLRIPPDLGTAATLLSCNLPTAILANDLAAITPGESVALVGCGPTGLMTLDLALRRDPAVVYAIDPLPARREHATRRGAIAVDPERAGWKSEILEATHGRGIDKVFEVVGLPEALQSALDLIRPGGTIAAIGVFADNHFDLDLADVFLRNVSLHMNGFASVQPHMKAALALLEEGALDPRTYFSHEFSLTDVDRAFAHFFAKTDDSLKVVVRP